MKVIHRIPLVDITCDTSQYPAFAVLKSIPDGLVIEYRNTAGSGNPLEIKAENYEEDTMTHVFWSTQAGGFIQYSDANRWRDLQSHLWFSDGCKYGMVFIITKFNGELYVDLKGLPANVDQKIQTYLANSNSSPIRAIAEIDTSINDAGFIKEIRARADLMREINPMDVLSSMEKQVDMLTELVVALVEDSATIQKPTWFDSFKSITGEANVLRVKSAEASLETIKKVKNSIRSLQSKFFEKRK